MSMNYMVNIFQLPHFSKVSFCKTTGNRGRLCAVSRFQSFRRLEWYANVTPLFNPKHIDIRSVSCIITKCLAFWLFFKFFNLCSKCGRHLHRDFKFCRCIWHHCSQWSLCIDDNSMHTDPSTPDRCSRVSCLFDLRESTWSRALIKWKWMASAQPWHK